MRLLHLICSNTLNLTAEPDKVPTVDFVAYNGGLLKLPNIDRPVVIDLSEVEIIGQVPLLQHHKAERIVGHSNPVVEPTRILGTGILSGTGEAAEEVKSTAKNGFHWQLSVGMQSGKLLPVNQKQSVTVNGQSFVGPIYVAKANLLREISFVPAGADPTTTSLISASLEGKAMTFEEWLASIGIDATTLTPDGIVALQPAYEAAKATGGGGATVTADAAFDEWLMSEGHDKATLTPEELAELEVKYKESQTTVAAKGKTNLNANATTNVNASTNVNANSMANIAAQVTLATRAETTRQVAITRLREQFNARTGNAPMINRIADTALQAGWNPEQAELSMHRASRVQIGRSVANGNGGSGNGPSNSAIIEAALIQAGGLERLIRSKKHNNKLTDLGYTDQVLQAAHTQFRGRLSLQQFLYEAARNAGYTGHYNVKANLRAILQASFSNMDVSGILSNVANKFLDAGFTSVPDQWRNLTSIKSVSDFKTQTTYRGYGSFTFEELAADGRIRHGRMDETSYTLSAKTYAKMFGVTRKDIYNDDLGALTEVPRLLGRGGAIKFNKVFWAEFINNSTFFASGNNNYISGGSSALSITGLNNALQKFRKMTDESGDYISVEPVYLWVPPELEGTAEDLYNGTNLVSGNTTAAPDYQRHARKYEPQVVPYLSDSSYTGYSAAKWYLTANPSDVAVMDTAFLDGQETPTVESADADFDQLGFQYRGFWDFGVAKKEKRGGVAAAGT